MREIDAKIKVQEQRIKDLTELKSRIDQQNPFPGEFVHDDERCLTCNGTGKEKRRGLIFVVESTCHACGGTGTISHTYWNGPGDPAKYAEEVFDSKRKARYDVTEAEKELTYLIMERNLINEGKND